MSLLTKISTTQELSCKLSPDELLAKSKQHAAVLTEIDRLEEQLKTESASTRADIKQKKNDARELTRQIHTGEEMREILCYEQPRYDLNRVDIIREDLGTLVDYRPMRPDERQLAIDAGEFRPSTVGKPPTPKRGKKKDDFVEDGRESDIESGTH